MTTSNRLDTFLSLSLPSSISFFAFLTEARFVPVEIVAEAQTPVVSPVLDNHIAIELAGGHRMRISGAYDPEALARLIRGLTA